LDATNHIVFLCSRLDLPGGIERAVVATSNLLAENGHRVTLLVLDTSTASFYAISPKVTVLVEPLNFGINSGRQCIYAQGGVVATHTTATQKAAALITAVCALLRISIQYCCLLFFVAYTHPCFCLGASPLFPLEKKPALATAFPLCLS
jgi:hypothetical protein